MDDHAATATGRSPAPGTGTARHTRWQRFIRALFTVFGPAQTGVPPYATPAEREAWAHANAPLPPQAAAGTSPPGYRTAVYTDESGTVHRSLIREPSADQPSGAADARGGPAL